MPAPSEFTFEEAVVPESFSFEEAAREEIPKLVPEVRRIPRSPEELAAERFWRLRAAGLEEGGISAAEPFTRKLPGGWEMSMGPGPGIPTFKAPPEAGIPTKIATGTYNVLAGIPNFALSPEGIATAMIPGALPARLARPILGGVFSGLLTKSAAQLAGESSVTKDPQTITEAALTAGLGGLSLLHGATLPRATAEAKKGVVTDAAKERIEPEGRVAEYPGAEKVRVPAAPGRSYRLEPGKKIEPAEVSQEGQARLLLEDNRPAIKLMPDVVGEKIIKAEKLPTGEWETHDQIIERTQLNAAEIDRRIFVDRTGAEKPGKPREQTAEELAAVGISTKVPGEAHSTDVNKLVTEAVPRGTILDPGIEAIVQAERKAIDDPIDIVTGPADPSDPFAVSRENQFMGANFEKKSVELYPTKLETWLREEVPPEKWAQSIRARLIEESFHLKTPPEKALAYWRLLSALEQYGYKRLYLGPEWRTRIARGEVSEQDLGFEAIRHRMQRLKNMTTSEAAEAAGVERWTVGALEVMEDVVLGIRETLGTKASREQAAMIGKILENVGAAKAAASSYEKERQRVSGVPGEAVSEQPPGEAIVRQGLLPRGAAGPQVGQYAGAEAIARPEAGMGPRPAARFRRLEEQFDIDELKEIRTNLTRLQHEFRMNAEIAEAKDLSAESKKWLDGATRLQKDLVELDRRIGFLEMGIALTAPGELGPAARRRFREDLGRFEDETTGAPTSRWIGNVSNGRATGVNIGEYQSDSHSALGQSGRQRWRYGGPIKAIVEWTDTPDIESLDAVENFLYKKGLSVHRHVDFATNKIVHRENPDWRPPEPAARRRYVKGTPEMYMPPVARGEVVERGGFGQPTGDAIRALAEQHFQDISKLPDLDTFRGQLESQYGALNRDAVYYAWQDAMFKRLMQAKGTEIEALMDKLNLRRPVAEALKPGEAEPMLGRGRIPDAFELPAQQMSLAEINKFFQQKQWKTRAAYRQKFGPEQRRRYAAIGEIAGKLTEQAGPAPKKPWSRTQIGPEDVSHVMQVVRGAERRVDPQTGLEDFTVPQVESVPAWYTFKPEDIADPVTLGQYAVRGARVDSKTKATISNNVMVLRGDDGKMYVLSVFRDSRSGPKVVNPEGANLTARNIDAKLTAQYRPVAVAHLREPVESFRQVFDDQAAFDQHFGDIALEGTPGIRTSIFAGPQAGAARAQAGMIGARTPPPAEAGLPPSLTGPEFVSPTARELTAPGPRPAISGRMPLARYPQKFPPPAAPPLAPPGTIPPVTWQREAMVPPLPYETLPRPTVPRPITEYGKPAPRQPGTEIRAGLPPQLARRAPAALRRLIPDQLESVRRDLADMLKAKPINENIIVGLENAENSKNNAGQQAENRVRFASAVRPTRFWDRLMQAWKMGNKDVLAAANVLLESAYDPERAMWRNIALRQGQTVGDFDPRAIPIFRAENEKGRLRAQRHLADADLRIRRIGRAEMRTYRDYVKELDYAERHWNDADLQETAKRIKQAYDAQLVEMERRKINIHKHSGFTPHRYDAALWNGRSYLFNMAKGVERILGERTLAQRTFDSYYHAFGADAFLPVTRDSASLLGHYIRKTTGMMNREDWRQSLKAIKIPSGRELAANPKKVPGGEVPHDINYALVHDGYAGLSVHKDYAKLVERLVSPSAFETSPVLRAGLHFSQQLKHTLLAGDFFHLGRMLYYGTAVMGGKTGWKSGSSVLDIAERDILEALAKGIIRPKDVAWANTRVPFGTGTITRRQLTEKFYRQMGANLGRVQDALYKHLVTDLTPTSGPIRRGLVRLLDPTVGRYNRFLFDHLTRGMMAEANVREFERQMRANPKLSPHRLMRDIAKDVNHFFGNIGRQGWVQGKTWQDLNRILWLAPNWVEGLIKKEAISTSRLTGMSSLMGTRKGVTTLGTTGMAIGRGLIFLMGLTQAMNLIWRGKPTWQNEEPEHKWDAWIPGIGGDTEGFWFSPLAIYNEITHDLWRLWNSKPTFADAITQIIGNKEQPITRAALIALTGQSPLGFKTTTTASRAAETAKAMVPVPISFGRVSQWAAHKAAPGLVAPTPPWAVQRQAFATLGIKIEPAETSIQHAAKLARQFMEREGLTKTTGWQEIQTDEPGYTKLRRAIRIGDGKEARRNLEALRQTRSDQQIIQAMRLWKNRGFTGAKKTEGEFMRSLNDAQMEVYDKALEQKQLLYEAFLDWMAEQE